MMSTIVSGDLPHDANLDFRTMADETISEDLERGLWKTHNPKEPLFVERLAETSIKTIMIWHKDD